MNCLADKLRGTMEWPFVVALLGGCLWLAHRMFKNKNKNRKPSDFDMVLSSIKAIVNNHKVHDKENRHEATLYLSRIRLHGANLRYVMHHWQEGTGIWMDACQVNVEEISAILKQQHRIQEIPMFALVRNPTNSPHSVIMALCNFRIRHINLSGSISSPWPEDDLSTGDQLRLRHALQCLIQQNPSLEVLDLSNNQMAVAVLQGLGLGLASATSLGSAYKLPTVSKLILSGCRMTDEMLQALLEPTKEEFACSGRSQPKHLKLSRNSFTSKSLPIITKYLRRNNNLEKLDLSLNKGLFEGVTCKDFEALSNAILSSPNLQKLNMLQTGMTTSMLLVFLDKLSELGCSSRLTHLGLSLPSPQTTLLTQYLANLDTVQVLHCAPQRDASGEASTFKRNNSGTSRAPETPHPTLSSWENALAQNLALCQLFPPQLCQQKHMVLPCRDYLGRNKAIHRLNRLLVESDKHEENAVLWAPGLQKMDEIGGSTALYATLQLHITQLCGQ